MDEQSKHILNLNDADFLSFLYSERDRENSLRQFHGWNNWAIVGAFVTVLWTGYSIALSRSNLNWKDVFYYAGGLFSIFLICNSWWRFITKRERGIDFSKVRMLKEVVPIVQIGFLICSALASAIIIPVLDGFNGVFWSWIVLLSVMAIVIAIIIVFKNKLVPSFFEELFLPWIWVNVVFVTVLSGILGLVYQLSFKTTESGFFSSEFSVAACVVAGLIALFVFFTINTTNKSSKRFDAIIDKYLYLGATKEETLHAVIKNRIGYGVMDSCERELKSVQDMFAICERDAIELDSIKQTIIAGGYSSHQLRAHQKRIDGILTIGRKALLLSKRLNTRVSEILVIVSTIKDKTDIEKIINSNEGLINKEQTLIQSINEIIELINGKLSAGTEVK